MVESWQRCCWVSVGTWWMHCCCSWQTALGVAVQCDNASCIDGMS